MYMSGISQKNYESSRTSNEISKDTRLIANEQCLDIQRELDTVKNTTVKKMAKIFSLFDIKLDFSPVIEGWQKEVALNVKLDLLQGKDSEGVEDVLEAKKEHLLSALEHIDEYTREMKQDLIETIYALSKDWQCMDQAKANEFFLGAIEREQKYFDHFFYAVYVREATKELSSITDQLEHGETRYDEYLDAHVSFFASIYHLFLAKLYAGLKNAESKKLQTFRAISKTQVANREVPKDLKKEPYGKIYTQLAPVLREISRILADPDLEKYSRTKIQFLCAGHHFCHILLEIAKNPELHAELRSNFEFVKSLQPCDISMDSPLGMDEIFERMKTPDPEDPRKKDYDLRLLFVSPMESYLKKK